MQIGDKVNQRIFNIVLAGQAKKDFGKGHTQVKASCMAVLPYSGALVLFDMIIIKVYRATNCTNDIVQFEQVAVATFKKDTWVACAPLEGEEVNAICDTQ